MRKYNLFNFVERKISNAELVVLASKAACEVAFREMALHIAISYIANSLSKCEIKTYKDGEEKKERLYYKLNVSPNPNENSSQFINKFVENYCYNGEALLVPSGEHIYCADSFHVDTSNPLKELIFENVTFGTTTVKNRYRASEIFHIKLDNKDVKGLVDALNTKYSELMGLAMESYRRTNGKKYKLMLERYTAGDPNFTKTYEEVIKKQLKPFIENDNAVYPQFKDVDLQEFSTATPINSADIIALRKEIFDTTANAFKMPLPLIHGNMTNIKDVIGQFLTFCIDPIADAISEELTRKYYGYDEWRKGNFIEVDTSCINYIDIFEVADKADKAIASGLCSIDELRPRIKLNPLGNEFGRTHFITKNYDVAEKVLSGERG